MRLFDESQHISSEKYKALEADNCARISDLAAMKEKCLSGRGFPSESLLKEDNKLTSFYTGMPSYSVLISSLFNLVEKRASDKCIKLQEFECFLLTLMNLRLHLANFDLGFRFCVHESTISRILINWVQILDVCLSPLIIWPNKSDIQKTMPWCFKLYYGLSDIDNRLL